MHKRTYFILKVLDANWNVKKEMSFKADDITVWGIENEINNFEYTYGDIIKLWCSSPLNQMISGKILNATNDYSKGLKSVEDLEEIYFKIIPKGLKELKNKSPEISGLEDIVIRQGTYCNYRVY